MTVLIIHSSPRSNGCSSNIAKNIASSLKYDKLIEINLHKENLPYCAGCLNCVRKGIEYCPHSEQTLSFRDKMLKSDIIIVAAPVYIMHMSGQLKTMLDHYPSLFMIHRPEKNMFNKSVIIIATAAGGGAKQTVKEIKECFNYFGVSKVYKLPLNVQAEQYKSISDEKKSEIEKKSNKLIKKVNKNINKKKTLIKVKFYFYLFRMVIKKGAGFDSDYKYWTDMGWYSKERPWK